MTKSIHSLVADISKLFEGHTLTEAISGKFSTGLAEMFAQRFKEYGEEREQGLRLSNVGKPLRQLYYTLKGMPSEALDTATKTKFLYGDLIESLFVFLAIEAGHDVQFQQKEVEIDGVLGHIDCLIDGVLIDIKSASTFSYKKFTSGEIYNDDPFGYVAQLTAYRDALNGIDAGWFVIDKTLGHFAYVPLKLDRPLHIHKCIEQIREALKSDVEPDFCYQPKPVSKTDKTGNLILDVGCSYCGHKFYCHRESNDGKGLQPRFYSTGVKYFTKIVKEPNLKPRNTFEEFPIKEYDIN